MTLKTLLVASVFLVACAIAPAQAPDTSQLDAFFDRLAEKNQAMGSLVIVKDGAVVYSRAIGYAQTDAGVQKPLTPATRFRIASITKTFTAAMIFQLVEDGKLKLTDTLARFVPTIPNADKITVSQLLGHRSGIPNVRREQNLRGDVNTTPITKDEILALIVEARPDFAPDAQQRYSNSGYFLLGLLIEKVTGKSYADVLRERITSKLGLNDTYVATGAIDVNKNEALTYWYLGGWKQHAETHPSILFGAGAIISTPHDMANFIQALFDLKLVAQESLTAMKTIRAGDSLGLGLEAFQFAGRTFYGHAGGGDNYGSWLAYQPEEKLAIAYTTNAKGYPVVEIMQGIAAIYYRQPFQIPAFDAIAISPDVLDKYVGVYASAESPVKFTVTRDGSTLFVKPGAQAAAPLDAIAQDRFRVGINSAGPFFEFDPAENQMIVRRGGQVRVFKREH